MLACFVQQEVSLTNTHSGSALLMQLAGTAQLALSYSLNACSCLCRSPYVTGSSVLGITYAGGVMLASDTLGEHAFLSHWNFLQPMITS